MNIIAIKMDDVTFLSSLVKKSNQDVVDLFKLNINNAPIYPLFLRPQNQISILDADCTGKSLNDYRQ